MDILHVNSRRMLRQLLAEMSKQSAIETVICEAKDTMPPATKSPNKSNPNLTRTKLKLYEHDAKNI